MARKDLETMRISKHVAAQIREGVEYARQVIDNERTSLYAPDVNDHTFFARSYRHTMRNYRRESRGK